MSICDPRENAKPRVASGRMAGRPSEGALPFL